MQEFTVTFKPHNKSVRVERGTDVLTAAIRAGIILTAACGGEGLCGKCKILIGDKEVLACQTLVEKDLVVAIPKESLVEHVKISHESEEFTKGVILKRENVFRFSPLLPDIDLSKVRAVYGVAFDIGTTTVVGQLIDLNKKEILGTRISFNKQASYGSDVITRIIYASEPKGLETLNRAVLENINEIIEDLVSSSGINIADVYAISCAGNMTMMHLLLKIDPANIRKAPYIPATTTFPTIHTQEVGIGANPKGIISFLPGVTTYVGGDIVSGVLACGLAENEEISLLVDIGTNGEIVLGNKDWMIGAAASAGPAFEGSGLQYGMKAVKGAIQKVAIDAKLDVKLDVIGPAKPKGICGSGYIDLLCQMLKAGIIDKSGKIDSSKKSKRIRRGEVNYEFVLAFKDQTDIGKDITINEDDIENLKRSKGAVYSAIISLLNKVEKNVSEVKKIYIAGGFGNYLNIENSIYIGLLPDIARDVYEFIGNSSLAGARMSLLSHEALQRAYEIHKAITYVDLSSEVNYMDEYVASLFFPHTDLGRFPSIRSSR